MIEGNNMEQIYDNLEKYEQDLAKYGYRLDTVRDWLFGPPQAANAIAAVPARTSHEFFLIVIAFPPLLKLEFVFSKRFLRLPFRIYKAYTALYMVLTIFQIVGKQQSVPC